MNGTMEEFGGRRLTKAITKVKGANTLLLHLRRRPIVESNTVIYVCVCVCVCACVRERYTVVRVPVWGHESGHG